MSASTTKEVTVIFAVLLFSASLGSPGVIFIVQCLLIIILLNNGQYRLSRRLFYFLTPLFLLFGLGVIGSIRNLPYDALKDAWYLLKVIVCIVVGFLLMQRIKSFRTLLRIIVFVSLLSAIWHLLDVAIYGGFTNPGILFVLREEYGVTGSLLTVLGLICLLFCRRHLNIPYFLYVGAIFICSLSIVLSMSRTYVVVFLIMSFVMMGKKVFNPVWLVAGLLLLAVSFAALQDSSSVFADKIKHSAVELELHDYSSKAKINANWRGFEAYRALKTFMGGDISEKIFGQGFGSLIDLGFEMRLGGNRMEMIPMTHNGYMYVIVKFGVVGLLIYFYFIYKLIRRKSEVRAGGKSEFELVNRLIAGVGWLVLCTTLVITGVFNIFRLDSMLMVLGALLCLSQTYGIRLKAIRLQQVICAR